MFELLNKLLYGGMGKVLVSTWLEPLIFQQHFSFSSPNFSLIPALLYGTQLTNLRVEVCPFTAVCNFPGIQYNSELKKK